MNKLRKLIISSLSMSMILIALTSNSYSQETCKQDIRNAFLQVVKSDYKNLDVSYTLGTKLQQSDTLIYRNIEMKIFGKDAFLRSEDLTFYKNEKVSLTVKHDEKKVVKSGGRGMKLSGYMEGFMAMYDTMINRATVLSCTHKNNVQLIKLKFPEQISSLLKTTHTTYKLVDGKLAEMQVKYNSDYPISLFSIEIKKWDHLQSPIIFKTGITRLLNDPATAMGANLFPGYSFINNLK